MPATKDELVAAAASIVDALAFMRGPSGELIFVGEKALSIAWHLARAGVPGMDPERAVIKRRAIQDRPGQIAGLVDWVPVDYPDRDDLPSPVSAVGPLPDVSELENSLPWHVQTKIQGAFT